MARARSITTIMLKSPGDSPYDFLRPERIDYITEHPILLGDVQATLFVERRTPKPPRWADFFEDHVAVGDLGQVSSASAVLLIPLSETWFAVTFGLGRHLLIPEVYVPDFGLRVTLNAVGTNSIRSVDKETFDAIASHARQQAATETDVQGFGLNIERDLVHAVAGVPEDTTLADRLFGRDFLNASTRIDLDGLPAFLTRIQLLHE